jgi:hypothetical protein
MIQPLSIFAFCGPSGSGKSELAAKLLSFFPDQLTKWQQVTTRPQRNSTDDYLFITKDQYESLSKSNMLTCQTSIYDNDYGTFPEKTSINHSVLTIADRQGLESLMRDVRDHNTILEKGGTVSKLGDRPVQLFKVFVYYDLTEKSIERRGRTARGIDNIKAEVAKFSDVIFDITVDTTNEWPDVVKFFNNEIHSRVNVDEEFEFLRSHVITKLDNLIEQCNIKSVPEDFLRKLDKHLCEFYSGNTQSATKTYVAAALDNTLVPHTSEDFIEVTKPLSITDFGPIEGSISNVAKLTGTTGTIESDITKDDFDPINEVALLKPDPVLDVINSINSEPSIEPNVKIESESNTVTVEPSLAAIKSCKEIDQCIKFLDWMSQETIGIEVFSTSDNFKLIFQQYISANGGNPNDISVSRQSTKDGKGRTIIGYTAHMTDGTSYTVEFNTYLNRPVAAQLNN